MDSIFYHYTDFQALDGILHSAQLRVNNVLRMNDSAEMRHFMGRLSSAIVRQLAAEGETARARAVQALSERFPATFLCRPAPACFPRQP